MKSNLIAFDIEDNASLLEACDLLHDARFDLSTLQVDINAGIWKAGFEREFTEDETLLKHELKMFIFEKTTFPLADSELILTGIRNYIIEDKSGIEIYQFVECRIAGFAATLFFAENMKIILEFQNKPNGSFIDHRLLNKEASVYCFRNPFRKKGR